MLSHQSLPGDEYRLYQNVAYVTPLTAEGGSLATGGGTHICCERDCMTPRRLLLTRNGPLADGGTLLSGSQWQVSGTNLDGQKVRHFEQTERMPLENGGTPNKTDLWRVIITTFDQT